MPAAATPPATPTTPPSPVATPPAMTPISEVFAKAMIDGGKAPSAPSAQPDPAPESKPKIEAKPKEKALAPKPKSALDAVVGEPVAEPAKEPEAEEDPLKDLPEKPEAGHWPKARKLIEKQAAELKELRGRKPETDPAIASRMTELETKLAEREKTLAEKEATLAEYNDSITAINIELHPDFRREFVDGRKRLVDSAAAKLKSYGGNSEALIEALEIPEGKRRDAAIEEALGEDLSDSARAKILRGVADVEALDEKRAGIVKSPQQSFEELERKTQAQRDKEHAEIEQRKQTEFERITRELTSKIPTLRVMPDDVEDGSKWNAERKEDFDNAFKMLRSDAPSHEIIATAIKGQRFDRVVNWLTENLRTEQKKSASLEAQVAQYEGSSPDMRGGKPPVKTALEANLERKPGDIFAEAMSKAAGDVD